MNPSRFRRAALLVLMSATGTTLSSTPVQAVDQPEALLRSIAKADGSAGSDDAASRAIKELEVIPSDQIAVVLNGFDEASERGRNWLRGLAADVADNGDFPKQELSSFFADRAGDKDARYVAYQLLVQHDPASKAELLANAESDPSLPVRFLKIQMLLDDAARLKDDQPDKAKSELQRVVKHGRSAKQLEQAVDRLKELGVDVDLADALGLITDWLVIGPFDNTDSQQFETAYTPEQRYLESGSPIQTLPGEANASEKGKAGQAVQWQQIGSDDKLGMVDLNAPMANAKDAVAYAFCRFTVSNDADFSNANVLPAEARLGCINANQVWVNGKPVISNNVYHSGTRIDQYVSPCELQAGENTVLIKVLQNAQTESWAQDYEFQFRLTRRDGSPIEVTVVEPSTIGRD
ncbi:hypothetical protein [Rhodopirellula sp. MGV]|uniref:hypothetical protein n=1 Tax=Rhodopirellula sp. MGV TaxID=2023130 RepID=UPI000B9694F9|nr:hypothetical protein [Rhodopirellula sp. MGV]OYP31100.1 hypothetical protein CGZ80_21590 [Rhodopirellula sp. MGV]PNY37472.1 hypothetical protein C2E31_08105 [Rhodopirellula baltica]